MTIYRWGGKILRRATYGGIAGSEACCCGASCSSCDGDVIYEISGFPTPSIYDCGNGTFIGHQIATPPRCHNGSATYNCPCAPFNQGVVTVSLSCESGLDWILAIVVNYFPDSGLVGMWLGTRPVSDFPYPGYPVGTWDLDTTPPGGSYHITVVTSLPP